MLNVNKRVMIFIDGSNLFYSARCMGSDFRIDYLKLVERLKDGRDLVRTHYYASTKVPPIDKQTAFYDRLRDYGIKTTIKPLRNDREKGIDVALVTDLLINAYEKNMDVAVVVSGDQDFIDAIREVQRKGIQVEIGSFRDGFSKELQRSVDKVIHFEDFASDIKMPRTSVPIK